jgi:CarD family transcriptional regulator
LILVPFCGCTRNLRFACSKGFYAIKWFEARRVPGRVVSGFRLETTGDARGGLRIRSGMQVQDHANRRGKRMAQTVAKDTPAELDSTRGGFKIGDNVVYPTQGAGRIVDEVERVIGGKTMQFFELELLKGSTKVLIPKGQETRVGLRLITDSARVPELLELLRGPTLDLPEGWTPRHRQETTILSQGDIFQIAQLTGTLYRRDIERALSATERRVLDDARHMVVTEIAMALGVSLEEAGETIERTLE